MSVEFIGVKFIRIGTRRASATHVLARGRRLTSLSFAASGQRTITCAANGFFSRTVRIGSLSLSIASAIWPTA